MANWIHCKVAIHSGFESTYRKSLDYVFILQGLSLFELIGASCVFCSKLRANYMKASMGPRHPSSYAIAPAFYIAQADIYGPITVYVPGRERTTRSNRDMACKAWVMVFICNLSKACNLQVVEGHSAEQLADGLTRLTCEVGVPAMLLIDQDSALMHCLREGDIGLLNLETSMRSRTQIQFELCPVQGHNMHGLVERKIKSLQDSSNSSSLT